MTVDEQYMRIRRSLERKLGVEEASYLMDRPAGGWSELVTNHTLDLKLEALALDQRFESLRYELNADIQALRVELHQSIRQQTWALMTALFASLTVFATIFGLLARG
jgi:hypothetical protein